MRGRLLDDVVLAAGGLRLTRQPAMPGTLHVRVHTRSSAPPILPAPEAATESRRVDGTLWRRVWSSEHQLIADFLGPVVVVDYEGREIAVSGTDDSEVVEHLVLDHIVPLMLAQRGDLVLHGALIGTEECCLVLAGPTGAGKSTLTAACWAASWAIGGDDGAVVSIASRNAEPTYASIRITASTAALLGIDAHDCDPIAGKLRLRTGARTLITAPRELRAVVITTRVEAAEPRIERLSPLESYAAVFGIAFHVDLVSPPALEGAMRRAGDLVEQIPVFRLAMPHRVDALVPAQALLRRVLDHTC